MLIAPGQIILGTGLGLLHCLAVPLHRICPALGHADTGLVQISQVAGGHPVAALCSLPVQIGCLGRVLRHAVAELPADAQVALGTGIALLRRRLIPADSLLPVLFYTLSGDDSFRLYTLLVFVSVGLSAFIDNIPYVATMLPVVQGIAGLMNGGAGFPPELFYFGLLTGATLGGNLTPIGASANIAAIGILRKQGEQVRTRDFLRIGIPFTLAAVLTGYVYLWLVWGA